MLINKELYKKYYNFNADLKSTCCINILSNYSLISNKDDKKLTLWYLMILEFTIYEYNKLLQESSQKAQSP